MSVDLVMTIIEVKHDQKHTHPLLARLDVTQPQQFYNTRVELHKSQSVNLSVSEIFRFNSEFISIL